MRTLSPLAPRCQPSWFTHQDAIQTLTASDWRLLHELQFLVRCRKRDHPTSAAYVKPSQSYLARKVGVTREHVSRRTTVLHRLGLLTKIWRRPERGNYMTCIYLLPPLVKRLIARTINALSLGLSRVMYRSHKYTPTEYLRSSSKARTAQKGGAPPESSA